jgi:hypothetical protein
MIICDLCQKEFRTTEFINTEFDLVHQSCGELQACAGCSELVNEIRLKVFVEAKQKSALEIRCRVEENFPNAKLAEL